jgi:hypothetical protein
MAWSGRTTIFLAELREFTPRASAWRPGIARLDAPGTALPLGKCPEAWTRGDSIPRRSRRSLFRRAATSSIP